MTAERNINQRQNELINLFIDDTDRPFDLLFGEIFGKNNHIKTKQQTRKMTTVCKDWQLILSILTILDKKNKYLKKKGISIRNILSKGISLNTQIEYTKLVDLIRTIYYTINNDTQSDFYKLYYMNNGDKFVESFTELSQLTNGLNYLCMYDINTNIQHKHISHYFTIISTNNTYYISSSYRSEFVCVPYKTTKISIDQLTRFIDKLNKINTTDNIEEKKQYLIDIKQFYNTYFFQNNIPNQITENLMNDFGLFLKDQKIGSKLTNNVSTTAEINYLHKNMSKTTYHIGIIPKYESQVKLYVDKILPSPTYGPIKKRTSISNKGIPYLGGKYRNKTLKKIRKTIK